jgi:hypothetical protein
MITEIFYQHFKKLGEIWEFLIPFGIFMLILVL